MRVKLVCALAVLATFPVAIGFWCAARAPRADSRVTPTLGYELQISRNVAYANDDPVQKLDVYLPKDGLGKRPALIWIHGGGHGAGLGDPGDKTIAGAMWTYLKSVGCGP